MKNTRKKQTEQRREKESKRNKQGNEGTKNEDRKKKRKKERKSKKQVFDFNAQSTSTFISGRMGQEKKKEINKQTAKNERQTKRTLTQKFSDLNPSNRTCEAPVLRKTSVT